ncbi:MAG: energy transducer TonB [Bacteroidetes bacterium]|nr:MAG: energy transducer TonB [Bacteroidota bacterium]
MPDHHNKKRFLNLPKYIGGSKAFREFITENLRYPETALEAKVEGSVIVEYDILDNGVVSNPRVLKGLGYGCDEEAIRVVNLLNFEKVKNRGVRVKLTSKTNINFRLPKVSINYSVSYTNETDKPGVEPEQKNSDPVTYEYTIHL